MRMQVKSTQHACSLTSHLSSPSLLTSAMTSSLQPVRLFSFTHSLYCFSLFVAGMDVTDLTNSVTATPGDTEACLTFKVVDDSVLEARECFNVSISLPSSAPAAVAISNDEVQYCIADNDGELTDE